MIDYDDVLSRLSKLISDIREIKYNPQKYETAFTKLKKELNSWGFNAAGHHEKYAYDKTNLVEEAYWRGQLDAFYKLQTFYDGLEKSLE